MLMIVRMKKMRMIVILKICPPKRRIMEGGNRMEVTEKKIMRRKIMRIQRFLHKIKRNNKHMGLLITLSVLHKI